MPLTAPDGLPEINASTREVITLLLRGGPMPRAELARRLSLTPASLTKLTKPLVQCGLFVQVESLSAGSLGRPVQPLSVNSAWAEFVGVKLTGTGRTPFSPTSPGSCWRRMRHLYWVIRSRRFAR